MVFLDRNIVPRELAKMKCVHICIVLGAMVDVVWSMDGITDNLENIHKFYL